MPRLSDSMEEGTILRWLKSVGDEVQRGDELVEIETDKANMTYEAIDEGVLVEIVAAEGDTLPIGEVIARIGAPEEMNGAGPAPDEAGAGEPEDGSRQTSRRQTADAAAAGSRRRPSSRRSRSRSAAEQRTGASRRRRSRGGWRGSWTSSSESLRGSGPGRADREGGRRGGSRRRAPSGAAGDACRAASRRPAGSPPDRPTSAKGEVQVVELSRLQQTVARRMAESKATVPHFYLETEIDMAEAVAVREQLKQIAGEERPAPTFNDMVVKACALALREFPRANGSYRDGHFELYSRVNVGIAVAARRRARRADDLRRRPPIAGRDRGRRARRWRRRCATARSRRRSSRAARSRSPTSACTASRTSRR